MAVNAFISEVKNNKFSLISNLSETDAVHIWQAASKFIKKQMLQHKGVTIPGLGTFTFSQVKLPVGKNKCIVIQRPIFVFSEWFIQTHGLTCIKPCASGHIPVVPLNYSSLSNEGSYSRNSAELCIKEILLAMSHCLFTRKSVQLDFCNVGRLFVKDSKVKMKFFRDFIKQLDFDGELENIFRPQTTKSDISIMTNPFSQRSSTADNFLPRVSSSGLSGTVACPVIPDKSNDDSNMDSGAIKLQPLIQDQCDSVLKANSPQCLPKTILVSSDKDCMDLKDTVSAQNEESDQTKESASNQPCSCDRQELCYFCHQRNKRNVYVDVSEEKKGREEQYEKILHDYQDKKRHLTTAKDNDAKKRSQHYAKDAARYNFELAQRKKAERAMKFDKFYPSCILQDHTSSATETIKRKEYRSQLDSQVRRAQDTLQQIRNKREKMEKEERRDLAKRLDVLEKAYLQEKAARVAEYRKALAAQIQVRSPEVDHFRMDCSTSKKHPIFGIHDGSIEKDQKELNRAFVMDHLTLVRENDKKAKEQVIDSKKEEAEMLRRAKQELLQELQISYHDKLLERKKLEESWAISQRQKQKQLLCHDNEPTILLHEQCEKYERCQRCQRHRNYDGKSKLHHGSNNIV